MQNTDVSKNSESFAAIPDEIFCSVNGRITPLSEAAIPALDRGALFGESAYEVLRTLDARPLFWREHEERLLNSVKTLGFPCNLEPGLLRHEAEKLVAFTAQSAFPERSLRVVLSSGVASRPLLDAPLAAGPTRVIFSSPLHLPDARFYREGCRLHLFTLQNLGPTDPHAKSSNKTRAKAALTAAQSHGAYEALLELHGEILEGASSTIFLVMEDRLFTPPLSAGILDGVTRRYVLKAANSLKMPVEEVSLPVSALEEADEVFITSSTRGVLPVAAVDERLFPAPGSFTARLSAAYLALARESFDA